MIEGVKDTIIINKDKACCGSCYSGAAGCDGQHSETACCGSCYYFDIFEEQWDQHPGLGYCLMRNKIPDFEVSSTVDCEDKRAAACKYYMTVEEFNRRAEAEYERFLRHEVEIDAGAEESKLNARINESAAKIIREDNDIDD